MARLCRAGRWGWRILTRSVQARSDHVDAVVPRDFRTQNERRSILIAFELWKGGRPIETISPLITPRLMNFDDPNL
jgi:hypothetical protein